MRTVEYKDISPRLDQERTVVLSNRLLSLGLQVVATFTPTQETDKIKEERYPTAEYSQILDKFYDGSAHLRPGKTMGSIAVLLSVDEQRYVADMFDRVASDYSKIDESAWAMVSNGAANFNKRCEVANREVVLPPGVIMLNKPRDLRKPVIPRGW